MQTFTKIEISWIAAELEKQAKILEQQAADTSNTAFAALCRLRYEQYIDISNRLREALKKGSKRIKIK